MGEGFLHSSHSMLYKRGMYVFVFEMGLNYRLLNVFTRLRTNDTNRVPIKKHFGTASRPLCFREGVKETELRAGRMTEVVRARRLFCQLAVKKLRYYGAEVARYLGMITSAVNRSANWKELPEIKDYL